MGNEGAPKNEEYTHKENTLRETPKWNALYKKQLSYYGSSENAHTVQMEYKEELESGEITFQEALKEYAKRMTDSTYRMSEKMQKLEQEKREIYGGEEE